MGGWSRRNIRIGACALVVVAAGLAPVTPGAAVEPAAFAAAGSVEQVYVTHATPGAAIELRDASDAPVADGVVDDLGSKLFRDVPAGAGYRVVIAGTESGPLAVAAPTDTPPQSLYDGQHLIDGFQYITTRDGTKLSATVRLPGPPENGPYPTVIEYSGYNPSQPGRPQPSTQIAQLLGYATVGVNVRGTGCSGGAFRFFETLSQLDGYDVVETVAAQPWVLHGEPGMVGISYPGIAQTFTGPTQPPHLAALAPLSVVADMYRSLADPGGIPNTGFPREWADERDRQAEPYGQGWERAIVRAGGENGAQCEENQLLRHQNTKLVEVFDEHPFREPVADADGLSPELLAGAIDVPVFMGGAWQDEQTGGQFSRIWPHLTSVPKGDLKLFGTNGTHVDSLVAEFDRWYEFLEFYVARRIPVITDYMRLIAPVVFEQATGIPGIQLPPDRFAHFTDYGAALAAYRAEDPVRIVFENGGGNPDVPGAPSGTYEMQFSQWPPREARPTAWYFGADGTLSKRPPRTDDDGRGATPYVYDPTAKPATNYTGSGSSIWGAAPDWDWRQLPLGKALAFDSPRLGRTTVMAGPASVDLWVRSTAADTDLEVTLTELRPDGEEIFVQSGWLRASQRALAPGSTALEPLHPHTEASAAPLPAGEFVQARVAVFPFAHVFRANSRLRVTVEAPGGNRPFWSFAALGAPTKVVNEIAHSAARPSKVVLPVIDTDVAAVPVGYPACANQRGTPCREWYDLTGASGVIGSGAPTRVHAVARSRSARLTWRAPSPRPGDRLVGYQITDRTTGGVIATASTATNITVPAGAGSHSFTITARYASGGAVAGTPSNVVRVRP